MKIDNWLVHLCVTVRNRGFVIEKENGRDEHRGRPHQESHMVPKLHCSFPENQSCLRTPVQLSLYIVMM